MPRNQQGKNYFNFSKGILTEFSPLNFPEGSCVDILNMELNADGTLSKRKGLATERTPSGTQITSYREIDPLTLDDGYNVSSSIWSNVGGNTNLNLLCIQIQNRVEFYDTVQEQGVLNSPMPFTLDLSPYILPTAKINRVSFESALGYLFITSNYMEPIYVAYDALTNTITSHKITIQIRDQLLLDDGLAVDERPASLSNIHKYNLYNRGWDDTKINAYKAVGAKLYPSNVQIWYAAKTAAGAFDPAGLDNIQFGTSVAAGGKYVVNAFNIDRTTVSGISGLPNKIVSTRPQVCIFYAGRILYAGAEQGIIYISKIIQDQRDFGICYQEADPSAEQVSDIIASDGIYLKVLECGAIYKLVPIKDGVVIFASNGVWQLRGMDGIFSATNYQTIKITSIAACSTESITIVEDIPVYLSEAGVYTLEDDPNSDYLKPVNISLNTIQSSLNNLSVSVKNTALMLYDLYEKKLYLLFDRSLTSRTNRSLYQYTDIFIYSIRQQAWTRFDIPIPTNEEFQEKIRISSAVFLPPPPYVASTANLYVLDDQVVVGSNPVVIPSKLLSSGVPTLKRLCIIASSALIIGDTGNLGINMALYYFTNTKFFDYYDYEYPGIPYFSTYDAYVITGHSIINDAVLDKQGTYVYTYLRKTETQYIDDGNGNIVFDLPSSCLMQTRWEFTDSVVPKRWSLQQQVYRPMLNYIPPDVGNTALDGFPIIITRTKINGHGKVFNVKFEGEYGKDMQLLGWAVYLSISQRP